MDTLLCNEDGDIIIADTTVDTVVTLQETLAFLYAGSGTETTYTWDAAGVTYADILVVGGGGGGSCSGNSGGGGGGGAGGVIIDTVSLGEDSYTITVGAGGNSAIGVHAAGTAGKNSSAFGLTAIGGGAGNTGTGGADINGGSGGGSGTSSDGVQLFGTGVSGQGNNGGTGVSSGTRAGGGGGGAGGVGGNGSSGNGGTGGIGIESSISGISTYYAGGGAGATTNSTTISAGGNGGGGATFANGTNGLGGGGGAGYSNTKRSGSGGSGIVIVKPNPGALDGLGSAVYTTAVGAYALRRLFGAYTGPQVRLRRSTDDEETDVTFDKYGYPVNFDLDGWLGGGTGYIVTWYDQSPASSNAAANTVGNQPILAHFGGKWVVQFDGIAQNLRYSQIDVLSVWCRYYILTGTNDYTTLIGRAGADRSLRQSGDNTVNGGSAGDWIAAGTGEWSLNTTITNNTTGRLYSPWVQWNTYTGNRSSSYGNLMNEMGRGSWSGEYRGLNGYMSELILYSTQGALTGKHTSLNQTV